MLASHLFYSKDILKAVEPFIRKQNTSPVIESFPLLLSNTNNSPIKYYNRFFVSDLHQNLFKCVLKVLSKNSGRDDGRENNEYYKMLEPRLYHKIKSINLTKKYLQITDYKILSCTTFPQAKIHGVFMHR